MFEYIKKRRQRKEDLLQAIGTTICEIQEDSQRTRDAEDNLKRAKATEILVEVYRTLDRRL